MPRAAFSKTAISRMLEGANHPAYVLDERRRIVYANPALAEWLGVERQSLSGLRCDYHTEAGREAGVAAGLAPPPAVFAGQAAIAAVHATSRDVAGLSMNFLPITCESKLLGVLAVECGLPVAGPTDVATSELASHMHHELAELRRKYRDKFSVDRLVGNSPQMRRVRDQVVAAIDCAARVVTMGPPGSGREHLARLIHAGRSREAAAIVPLACPLLDAELLRTTVTSFIHRCAELETDEPPSLLLIDVDELPLDAQAELEGFLSIEELGLRTLATAKNSLLQQARQGSYRLELAHMLSTIEIALPPLAGRLEDIPLLAQLFLEQFNAQGQQQLAGFAIAALEQLVAYPWPGNVDELRNVVRECARQCPSTTISVNDLPATIRLGMDAALHPIREVPRIQLDSYLTDVERQLVLHALNQSNQNKAEAARHLGISRGKLLRRIAMLGL